MKKMRITILIITFCFSQLFIQCSTDDNKEIEKKIMTGQEASEISQLRSFLSTSMKTDITKIIYDLDMGGFIIDGDVLMTLEDARDRYNYSNSKNTSKTSQNVDTYIMTPEVAASVKVYVSPEVPSEWKIAISEAINNWNTANTSISITTENIKSNSTIVLESWNGGSSKSIAYASMPSFNGQPGKLISINTYYNYLSASTKISVIMHELGHSFGLKHTNLSEGSLIPCTSSSDIDSVMHSIAGDWINGFSYYDKVAISILYPVAVGTKKLYRYKKNQYYFYSTNPCEIIPGKDGYVFDGDCGYIFTTQIPGTVPLYRTINGTVAKGHNLRTDNASNNGVIIGYLYNYQRKGTTALYYNPLAPSLYRVEYVLGGMKIIYGFVVHKFLTNSDMGLYM